MDGSIAHWYLSSSTPSTPLSYLENAHDSTVWALDYHPLGYVLASASKDYSTRFWARARPTGGQEVDRWHIGDTASEAAGKPKWSSRAEEDDQGKFFVVWVLRFVMSFEGEADWALGLGR
jgi:polyadenylation factor subunit 2